MRPRWALALIVFAWSFLIRFLDVGFVDDHFPVMVQGRQMLLFGELPARDFIDPGFFLLIYGSAAAQALFGHNLLGEALLGCFFFALGAGLAFALAAEASGSAAIGLLMAALLTATFPRLNHHYVVFLPLLALTVCWRYADRPTPRRLAIVGGTTAVAFLIRHDQAGHVGVAAIATLVSRHRGEGPAVVIRRLAVYGAIVTMLLMPFLVFLEANGGVIAYARSSVDFLRSELSHRGIDTAPFAFDPAEPLLTFEPPPPRPPTRIRVRWSPRVADDLRARLERDYRLGTPRPSEQDRTGRSWTYVPDDASAANMMALARDRRVEDTDGIDRQTGRVNEPREPWLVSWQRAVPLLTLKIAPGVFHPGNALPWLYRVFIVLPTLSLVVLAIKRLRGREQAEPLAFETSKILGAVLLGLLAQNAHLRNPLGSRLPDAAAPMAILAAWLLGQVATGWRPTSTPGRDRLGGGRHGSGEGTRWRPATALRFARTIVAVTILGLTGASIATFAELGTKLGRSGVFDGPAATLQRGTRVVEELRTSPPIEGWAPADSTGKRALARYVHECTSPTDRLVVTRFDPELYFYSGRGFSGKQLFWFAGYFDSASEQQESIDQIVRDAVPIVIVSREDVFASSYSLVYQYITGNYTRLPDLMFGEQQAVRSEQYQVFVRNGVAPTGTYRRFSLPCYG